MFTPRRRRINNSDVFMSRLSEEEWSSGIQATSAGVAASSVYLARQAGLTLLSSAAGMAQRTLPVLFINLGGEMMYILEARLRAQAIERGRAAKVKFRAIAVKILESNNCTSTPFQVMNDIVSTMFNRRFIEEIFSKHQPIYSRRVLKTMFDKLAHASIMKLNSNSMDKLYDLMTMAVKQQVTNTLPVYD